MSESIDGWIERARVSGEPVLLATALDGPTAGARMLVWSAGHTFGDLGWPRLNQRVALYAEQLFGRRATAAQEKSFELPGSGRVRIRTEWVGGAKEA